MATETDTSEDMAGPRFPFITLERAIRRTRDLYKNAGDHPVAVLDAAKLWGYGDKASGWRQTVAALKYYGLAEDFGSKEGRKVKLTPEARRYMLDERPEEHAKLHALFALKPRAMASLWNKWGAAPPNDSIARSTLKLDFEYGENAAAQILAIYKANLVFAQLANPVPSSGAQAAEPEAQTPPAESVSPPLRKESASMQEPHTIQRPPEMAPGTRQDTCNLPEGTVVLSFPEKFSQESYADLETWLEFQKKRLKRWVSN